LKKQRKLLLKIKDTPTKHKSCFGGKPKQTPVQNNSTDTNTNSLANNISDPPPHQIQSCYKLYLIQSLL
jgi:hypothetical protein